MSPVIAKTFAAGIAMLYIAGMTSFLLGGVVPDYEAQAADELSERTLVTAAETTEQAVPEANGTVETTNTAELPTTIQDSNYRIELSNRTLTLEGHSTETTVSTQLSLSPDVTVEDGTWESGDEFRVRVSGPADNRTVRIES